MASKGNYGHDDARPRRYDQEVHLPLSADRQRRALASARAHPLREPVRYPRWYLQRWHFLPDGYLSGRGAQAYERLIPRLYNLGSEDSVLAALAEALVPHRPRRVLELACGPGHALAALARRLPEAELTGVDLSPFQLERAEIAIRRFGPRVTLRHASSLDLPFEDDAFDAVVAVHHFGHLPSSAAERVVVEAARVLSPGGRLFIVDHTWHRPPPLMGARVSKPLLAGLLRLDEIAPGAPALRPLLQFQAGTA